MKIIGIIPSRYASTRFPGKPLADIRGQTMIQRVYEQAAQSRLLTHLLVATDDERIRHAVQAFGGKVVMTSSGCHNGTERCAEAIAGLALNDEDVVINIQGDEPFVHPEQLQLLADCFAQRKTEIATLIKAHPLDDLLRNPSRIKVVINKSREALYFSRSIIPFAREEQKTTADTAAVYYKHIGLYAYRVSVLRALVQLPPTPLEETEKLEQLRWLENGYRITCALTPHESIAIDTPDDLTYALKFLQNHQL